MNFVPGRVVGTAGTLHFIAEGPNPFRIPVRSTGFTPRTDRPAVLGLRPEHLHLGDEETAAAPDLVRAEVESIERTGAETHVHLRPGPHRLVARAPADWHAQVGTSAIVRCDGSAGLLFDPDSGRRLDGATASG